MKARRRRFDLGERAVVDDDSDEVDTAEDDELCDMIGIAETAGIVPRHGDSCQSTNTDTDTDDSDRRCWPSTWGNSHY